MQPFSALCYHNIRPDDEPLPYFRTTGISESLFRSHIEAFKIRTPEVRFTFDDGLVDHFMAAKILHEYGLRGTFFIPTCILEGEPANPQIVHYTLAVYGVEKFVASCKAVQQLPFEPGEDQWVSIGRIKKYIRHELEPMVARQELLELYRALLLHDDPNALTRMHVTKEQMREMVAMGHTLGTHTHTHISVGMHGLQSDIFEAEMVRPKQLLEAELGTSVDSFSYPFGETQDCLSNEQLQALTREYHYGYTINPILNTDQTPPLELGRYMVKGGESVASIDTTLLGMESRMSKHI